MKNMRFLALLAALQASLVAVYGFTSPSRPMGITYNSDVSKMPTPSTYQHRVLFRRRSDLSMVATKKTLFSRLRGRKTESSKKKNIVRIPVKSRPLVVLDEKTGKYVPQQSLPDVAVPGISEKETLVEINQVSGWDTFKGGVYNMVDGITSIRRTKSKNSIKHRTIAVAYSDTIEAKVASSDKETAPGQKLMQQYEASLKTTPENVPRDLSNGENLFKSDLQKSFDSAKDSMYGTIDNLSWKKKPPSSIPNTQEVINKLPSKTSINNDVEVTTLSANASALNSANPLKRLKASLAIFFEERKRKRFEAAASRRAAVDNLKRFIFDFIDTVQVMYEALLSTPAQLERSALSAQDAVEETMLAIQKTPEKIQRVLEDTKKSVEETQKVTMGVMEDVKAFPQKVSTSVEGVVTEVQAIPRKVETSMEQTKQGVQQTVKGVQQFMQKVEDMTNEMKYMTGLEARPPPPPKPPRTTEELAKDVAVGVAKGTASLAGKAGVVVAKGTAGMAVSGAKLAWQAATADQPKKTAAKSRDIVIPASSMATKESKAGTPKSIAEIDPSLEAEVVEALRVAEEALAAPKAESAEIDAYAVAAAVQKRGPVVSTKDIDINEAVRRAKTAAAQAKRDADELEAMLAERRIKN